MDKEWLRPKTEAVEDEAVAPEVDPPVPPPAGDVFIAPADDECGEIPGTDEEGGDEGTTE